MLQLQGFESYPLNDVYHLKERIVFFLNHLDLVVWKLILDPILYCWFLILSCIKSPFLGEKCCFGKEIWPTSWYGKYMSYIPGDTTHPHLATLSIFLGIIGDYSLPSIIPNPNPFREIPPEMFDIRLDVSGRNLGSMVGINELFHLLMNGTY